MASKPLPHKLTHTLPSGFSFDLIRVEGGAFEMGNVDEDAYGDENPIHTVNVETCYLAQFPVTQALWKEVMKGENPSQFEGDDRPVDTVSWDDAKKFLSALEDLTGCRYRLPTEAEWEFAARGGIHSQGYLYAGSDNLTEVGWFSGNNGECTVAVGQLLSNELGLYDMSGNVWEWCEDDWHSDYKGAPADGTAWLDAPQRGTYRVLRGGSWFDDAQGCRVAFRDYYSPGDRYGNIGFRLLFVPSQEEGPSGIPVS